MAIKIKSPAEIAEKFSRVTPGRSDDYSSGVQGTAPAAYESAAIAAEPVYNQAVTQAIARKAFSAGVRGKGARWQRKALDLGPGRFASGAGAAAADYAEGFAPYQAVLAGLTLPPRGPAGDPKNIERVRVIADALRKRKLAG
jgi:hypothetical protein